MISDQDLYLRTKNILNPEVTRDQTFLFIGAGSGGSRVAEEAARFGVGTIILVDKPNESLALHNVLRHTLGHSAIGSLKVDALRTRLLDINPNCHVEAHNIDVCKHRLVLEPLIARSTQIHLCTDNERSRHAVNEVVIQHQKPMIFAGVFDGGIGGEVGTCLPGEACYACIAESLSRSEKFDGLEQQADYSNPEHEEAPSTSALNIDIAQICLIHARVALGLIMPEFRFGGNYILFGNRPYPGLFEIPLESIIWTIPQKENCLVCGKSNRGNAEEIMGLAEVSHEDC